MCTRSVRFRKYRVCCSRFQSNLILDRGNNLKRIVTTPEGVTASGTASEWGRNLKLQKRDILRYREITSRLRLHLEIPEIIWVSEFNVLNPK